MTDKAIVGIDVSKEWIDIAVAGARDVERLANTTQAISAWLDRSAPPAVVAFEPTGGYERPLLACLGARDIVPFRVHPNAIVAFRKSRGIRAKTDRIDARLIADFAADAGARGAIRPTVDGDPVLRELAARRRQLVDSLHAERCRLDRAQVSSAVRQSLTAAIEALIGNLKTIEAAIDAAIAENAGTARRAALLRSVKGVGPITAATLIADLPELGRLSAKEIAALVGLAPQNRESGKAKAKARIGHGRPGVRKVLFNAARSAIRHNPVLRAFYQKLVGQNGRPGKVALIAVMRKILVILNAIARDGQPWKYLAASP